jgi:hypothetical protein
MSKVSHGGSTLIEENQPKKEKKLDHIFYVKDFK